MKDGFLAFHQSLLVAIAALGCGAVYAESDVKRGEARATSETTRLRLIVETDAGGDPDDEQSLVRFLLYANEWDVEGIIANRSVARDRENLNPERTGLGIVRRLVKAYGECYPHLVQHDARYPKPESLLQRTVAGYEDRDDGVELILGAVNAKDPRPIWFLNWGTDHGSATSCLKRALDRVLNERGPQGYAAFKNKLRLSSADKFGEHMTREPPFTLWVDTFRPPLDGKRWYHRFSELTATAGGFDLRRDVLTGHGPWGALYPTNTTHPQKEGDTMTFLYLVPTGMNDPEQPTCGSWAGRYGPNPESEDRPYYWANQADTWQGTTHRDNTLKRWAADLQNDFRARLDWCVKPYQKANHPPAALVNGEGGTGILHLTAEPGATLLLDAKGSSDPDGHNLNHDWFIYREAGTYPSEVKITSGGAAQARLTVPGDAAGNTFHVILAARDEGTPPLARYRRVVVNCTTQTLAINLTPHIEDDQAIYRLQSDLTLNYEGGYVSTAVSRTLEEIDAIYASMPPLGYNPPADRGKFLARTSTRLRDGAELRVVMLGDSIVNDTSRSQWHLLLERDFPKCKITKFTSVRGSTGCWWYKDNNRVKLFVLDQKPDLVMIGGISHRDDVDAIREVVRQLQAGCDADILLMTGAFGHVNPLDDKQWQEEIDPDGKDYRAQLRRLASELNVEFLDMHGPWGRYIRDSGKELVWFKRDDIHANERGEQILGRILSRYLAPAPK